MLKNNILVLTLKKKNITDFAEARNEMLRKAGKNWVLFLDTDEKMDKNLEKEISEKLKNTNTVGYYIKRENYFLGKHIGNDRILRLAKADKGKWVRSVHEVWKVEGPKENLVNPIIHNTASGLFEYIAKINKYSEMHAKANLDEGKRSGLLKIFIYPVMQFMISVAKGRGIVFSILQSFHSFLGWSEMYLIRKNENN